MTELTCDRCGETFDTDRDEVVPGQSMERCSACGAKNDLPQPEAEGEGDRVDDVQVSADGAERRVNVHVHIHE